MSPIDNTVTRLRRDSECLWNRCRGVLATTCVRSAARQNLLDQANRYAADHVGAWPILHNTDSDHFRALFRKIVVETYPTLQRFFFIHIPRTAGSDLREALLSQGCAVINHDIDRPWSATLADQIAKLEQAVRAVESGATRVCLVGHHNPGYYWRLGLIREQDIIFCIARDPFEIAVSHLKFEARMLKIDSALSKPGIREFAAHFGVTAPPREGAANWEALIDTLLEKKLDTVAAGDFSSLEPYRRLLEAYTGHWCLEAPSPLPAPMRAVHYADYQQLKRHLGLDPSTRRNSTQDLAIDFTSARRGIAEQWRYQYRLFQTLISAPVRLFPHEFPGYFAQHP